MKKYKILITWVLIIAMVFSTNGFYVFADSFDMESISIDHIDDDESGKYYNVESETSLDLNSSTDIAMSESIDENNENQLETKQDETELEDESEIKQDETELEDESETKQDETEPEEDESKLDETKVEVEESKSETETLKSKIEESETKEPKTKETETSESKTDTESDESETTTFESIVDDSNNNTIIESVEASNIATDSEASEFDLEFEVSTISEIESDIELSTNSELGQINSNGNLFGDGTHSHKICGVTGACTHCTDIIAGTNAHTVINSWQVLNSSDDLRDNSKGPYFYLTEDKELNIDGPDVPASPRDLYICLNGYDLTLTDGIWAYGKIHITNCGDWSTIDFEGYENDRIRSSTEIYGINNNISCKYDGRVVFFNSGTTNKTVYLYSVDLRRINYADAPDIDVRDGSSTVVLDKVQLSYPDNAKSFIHVGSTNGTYYFINTILDFNNKVRYSDDGRGLFSIYENTSLTNNIINFRGNNVIKNLKLRNMNLLNRMNANEFVVNVLDGTTTFSDITMLNPDGSYGPKNFINKMQGYTISEGAILEFKNIYMTNDMDPVDTHNRHLISFGNNDTIQGGLVIDGCKSNDPYGKMVVLESGQKLKIGGDKVFIGNNINTFDNTNAAGIYVNGTRGDTPIISVNAGKTINAETYISGIVLPDNANYFGHIVDSFDSVSGGRACDEVFTAYNYKGNYRGLSVALKNGNVVIGFNHEHKICGVTGACTHTTDVVPGTDAHTLIDSWQPIFQQSDLTNVGAGPYFFLVEDKTLTFGDSLNRDVYICLNGHKLTYGANLVNTSYKVYITNCGAASFIEDNDTEIKTSVQIYGVDTNLTYNYGHYIVHAENPSQNIYLYDVSFKRTGNATDEDFRLGNNSDNSILTLEKVQMINCSKIGNDHTRLFTACPYNTVLNIIDSTFDYNNTYRKAPSDVANAESLFQASYDRYNFRGSAINFRGNNVFKNLRMNNMSLISTQNSDPPYYYKGVNNFNINFINGITTFQNITLTGNSTTFNRHFIDNYGEVTGGHITINEDATLEIKNINMTNDASTENFYQRHIMQLTAEDSILGNLIISDCVTNSDFGRILYLHSNDINVARPTIGNGKIQIVNNRTTSGHIASGVFSDDLWFTTGEAELFVVDTGKTINPETRIEGMLVHRDNQPIQPVMIVRNWASVSGGSECQDLYTSSYLYDQDVGVRLVDGHAKIAIATRCTVSFRDKDGNPLPGINNQSVNEGIKLKICTPSLAPKQEFIGWYKDLDDESTKWNFDTDRVYEEFTLYAKIVNHYTYNISYNANGGTGHMDDKTGVMTDTAITLDINTYNRINYKFVGWASTSDATIPDWIDGDTTFTHEALVDDETYTIYAVWKKILYTLHYDGNGYDGGVVPGDRESIESGDTIQLEAARPTRTNYKFLGWATSSTATVGTYNPGGNFSYVVNPDDYDPTGPEPIKTIYAVWKQITYTVTYNKNGGEGADMPVSSGESGSDLTLSTNTYTKTNYRFRGWDENPNPADPLNPQYPIGSMTMNKVLTEAQDELSINVYAIWTKVSYTVTYHSNPGTGTVTGDVPAPMTGYSGEELTLADNSGGDQGSLAMDGQWIICWNESADGTGEDYILGDIMIKNLTEAEDGINFDLYAQWGNIPYIVVLNNNGGVGEVVVLPAESGTPENLPDNTFTRENYVFIGWSENETIDPDTFDPTATGNYPPTGGVVDRTYEESEAYSLYHLYAVWKKMLYTLSYDGNGNDGGVVPGTRESIESGQVIQLASAKPTKTNYKFMGWASSSTATIAEYQPESDFSFVLDVATYDPTAPETVKTIYAVWKLMTYTVSYNKNGGEGSDLPISNGTSGVDLTLRTNTYIRHGYKFIGWDESPNPVDPTSPQYPVGSMTMNKVLTEAQDEMSIAVYAIWQKYVYTLHYDLQGGTGTIPDVTDAKSGENVTISTIIPTKANSTFLGWSDTPGKTINPDYLAGGTYTATVDAEGITKTIYAVWNPMYEYTIRFNANGGTGSMEDIIATSSITRILPSNRFTKSDYTFIGWSENSRASSATYTNNITKSVDSSGVVVLLYAIWSYNGGGGGGSSSGGSSGDSGGSIVNPIFMLPKATKVNYEKSFKDILLAETGSWHYDPIHSEWKYTAKNTSGLLVNAKDGFYMITYGFDNLKNNRLELVKNETYYFDVNGNMLTGFVVTSDNKTYLFEYQKNLNEGTMIFGWKQVGSDWYYFGADGAMLVNTITPDGYRVSSDGKWI